MTDDDGLLMNRPSSVHGAIYNVHENIGSL